MKRKVRVAIIDTGIDINHDYLKDNIIGGIGFELKDDYIVVSENYIDENGHGTSCSSIIKSEYSDVEFFIVKALDKQGRTNIQVLEEALKYLLSVDIDIINLSLSVIESNLVEDLYKICKDIRNQGKIIVCSVANGYESSYPAIFDNVIGVRGFILEDESALWYNKNYDVECVIDNNSYLMCDINNSYKLFGKCNSQAAAKLTGRIASILSNNTSLRVENLHDILGNIASRRSWISKDLEESKRYPDFKHNKPNINKCILESVVNIIKEELNIDKDNNILYECGLFNEFVGLDSENCFNVIKKLESKFNLNFDYLKISRYDLISAYTLTELIENKLNGTDI